VVSPREASDAMCCLLNIMCCSQEFIQSIDEMVKAKTDVKDLRNQISLLNQDVQTSGAALLEKVVALALTVTRWNHRLI